MGYPRTVGTKVLSLRLASSEPRKEKARAGIDGAMVLAGEPVTAAGLRRAAWPPPAHESQRASPNLQDFPRANSISRADSQ